MPIGLAKMATIVEFDEYKKKSRSEAMVARASVRSRVPTLALDPRMPTWGLLGEASDTQKAGVRRA